MSKFNSIPDLVAEHAPAKHTLYIKIDESPLQRVGKESLAQSVSPALRNALFLLLGHSLGRFLNLFFSQIALPQRFLHLLQRKSINHPHGIDDVAQGLGHFASVGVSHYSMQLDGVLGQSVCQLQTEHNHSSHPEE